MADLASVAQMLGIAAGGGAASFAATWIMFVRKLDKPESDDRERRKGTDERHKDTKEKLEKLESRIAAAEQRLGTCITDELFDSYTRHTTTAVQGLAEKVGHVTGVVEGWQRSKP